MTTSTSSGAGAAPAVRTCLWFDGRIEEAADFYVGLLPGSRVTDVSRSAADSPFPGAEAGEALTVDLELAGVPYQLLNGGPQFPQSEAVSISVTVDGQTETDRLWHALVADGGEESQCGWCRDRFGVSWQIVPREVLEMMAGPQAKAAAEAMFRMRRLDIAEMRAACEAAAGGE